MIFEHLGYTALRLASDWYMVIGQNFRGYAASKDEAWHIIQEIISQHCWE
jgi:hypothetical protein